MTSGMRKKGFAVLAAIVLLFAACGKEGEPEEVLGVGSTSSPTPQATGSGDDDAAATEKPASKTSTSGATNPPTTTASGSAGAGSTPARTAVPGKSQPPKDGRYVYSFKGKANDPTNPAAGQQEFDGEAYNEITHSGDVYTFESTNSEQPGRSILRSRWTSAKVELLEIKIETAIGTFGCKFDPPLTITKFPIKPETYPTQNFKGSGNACDGKLDITIEKQETMKDAAGTTYDTWRAKVRTEVHSDSFDIVMNETRWASPDLGVEIKSIGTQDGQVSSGAFNSKFEGSATRLLKQHP